MQFTPTIVDTHVYLYTAFLHGMQYQRLHIVLDEHDIVAKSIFVCERLGIIDKPELVQRVTASFIAGYKGMLSL